MRRKWKKNLLIRFWWQWRSPTWWRCSSRRRGNSTYTRSATTANRCDRLPLVMPTEWWLKSSPICFTRRLFGWRWLLPSSATSTSAIHPSLAPGAPWNGKGAVFNRFFISREIKIIMTEGFNQTSTLCIVLYFSPITARAMYCMLFSLRYTLKIITMQYLSLCDPFKDQSS